MDSRRSLVAVVLVVVTLGALMLSSFALGFREAGMMAWPWSRNSGTNTGSQPITMDQAVQTFKNYLASGQDSNLALHEVEEYQYNFYASYSERDTGNFAFQMLIWKPGSTGMSGTMGYGMTNGMMGMMGGYRQGTSASMTVSPEQARTIAQQYLNSSLPGKTAGDADTYYGYYNIDVMMNGSTFGMISINGYTSQVWYHTWHGIYVQALTLS